MYYVVIRKAGQVVLCSAMYTETLTGQHQGDAILHHKEVHRSSWAWTILAHEEVLKCLDSCIPPSLLRCCIKNRSIWACYLRSYWETDHGIFLKNDKVSTPDHFLKIQWSKCEQVNIRSMLVRKWNYTDKVECGLLINACGCKYVSSYFRMFCYMNSTMHVSGHDQTLNDSKISFSAT